jgi:hypothetical protein
MDQLTQLAALIRARNAIDDAIAALIQRPAQLGHIGEYIAAIFDADALPDYYLVLTGPKSAPLSSRGATRPAVLSSVFLFDVRELVAARLLDRPGMVFGVATSIPNRYWDASEVYPAQQNPVLPLSDVQRAQLALFGPT